MVFNTIFNNISVILLRSFLLVDQGNQSTLRKPLTCHLSWTNFITISILLYRVLSGIQTHSFSGDRHWLH